MKKSHPELMSEQITVHNILKEVAVGKYTLNLFRDTTASARAFTHSGSRARENLMELKMAIVVKAC